MKCLIFRVCGLETLFVDQWDEEGAEEDETPLDIGEVLDGEPEEQERCLPFRVRCFAHNLNLLASKNAAEAEKDGAYKKASRMFTGKVRYLWSQQSYSTQQAEIIEEYCNGRLVKPTEVRWNSFYDSLVCVQKKIQESPDKLTALLERMGQRTFSEDELKWLCDYIMLQKHVAMALDKLQGEVGLGYALPTITMLKMKLESAQGITIGKPLQKALLEGLEKRFGEFFKMPEFILAAATTPMFKVTWLQGTEKEAAVALLKENVRKMNTPDQTDEVEPSQDEDDFFSQFEDVNANPENTCDEDVAKYLLSPRKDLMLLKAFPAIEKLYRKTNVGTPSSAPVERAFSAASNVLTVKRKRICDEHFETHLLLNSNKKFLDN